LDWIEIAGFITGIIAVWLTIKENSWCWAVWFACTVFYLIVFFNTKFYADTWLQVFYLITIIYGWYNWKRNKAGNAEVKISFSNYRLITISLVAMVILTLILGYIFSTYTSAAVPWWDSSLSAASIVATWLTAKKKMENWIIWIIADCIYVQMYLIKDLYLTAGFYYLLLILAIEGYYEWRLSMQKALSQ